MTRGSIPRFDLYEELEVSPLATPAVIEAAYRALVKRHHPDVASPDDRDRITRLNIARDWLLSPSRRARYDGGSTIDPGPAKTYVRRERRSSVAETVRPARTSSSASFGVNSRDVRQFLAELRELDGTRAAAVLRARAAVDATAHEDASVAALAASRAVRGDQWAFARDAASVIAKGKLSEAAGGSPIATLAAEIAGAIVVRDLIPASQFDLLYEPWRRSAPALRRVAPTEQRPSTPSARAKPVFASDLRAAARRRPQMVAILGAGAALLIAVAMFGRGVPNPQSAIAGLTNDPSGGFVAVIGSPSAPGPGGTLGTAAPVAASSPAVGATGTPGATSGPTPLGPAQTVGTGAGATTRPARTLKPAPTPSAAPTPTPTAAPTPTPTPLPTPAPVLCTVVNLVGENSSNAQLVWNSAGFTGTVLFSPTPPPQYKIEWQSLAVGTDVPCTSDITVQMTAP